MLMKLEFHLSRVVETELPSEGSRLPLLLDIDRDGALCTITSPETEERIHSEGGTP